MKRYGEKFYTESYLKSRSEVFSSESTILNESRLIKAQSEKQSWDVFLSHSSKDKIIVLNFRNQLKQTGCSVYVDWIDDSDSGRENITPKLKDAMNNSNVLIYLHTHNAKKSIWTPWEIGYYDSKKGNKKIGIVPLLDEKNHISDYSGQEYLLQYTEIGTSVLNLFIKNGIQ